MNADRGELALVLHTHMPYVEGFGTWPFGEEWLWEAIASSYLPLLELLECGAPLTLSLTPVLCDQLEAEGAGERCLRFLREVRADTHARDVEGLRMGGHEGLARELERSAAEYERAAARLEQLDCDLLAAFARHVTWTSAATHPILPLLATDAGVRLQLGSGVASHRRRFGDWGGGLWLPECAYAPWLDPLLTEAGVQAFCVELTDLYGPGAGEHLRPVALEDGPLAVPIDRATVDLAWGEHGYPAAGAYRDRHRHTTFHHHPWANHGGAYEHGVALACAGAHAADFVARTIARLERARNEQGCPGLCVCAFDTELLGHWWYEGVAWLAAVIDEAERQGLALARLDEGLGRYEPAPPPAGGLPVSSWGRGRDLSTWDSPALAPLVWQARRAELQAAAASERVDERALRELLLLQSSDWAFLVSWELAAEYGRDRAAGHARRLHEALAVLDSTPARVRNIAPDLERAAFLAP